MTKPLTHNESFVLMSALRYALPRRTHALGIVVDEIIREIPRMTDEQREGYLHEISPDRYKPVDYTAAEEVLRLREALRNGLFKGATETGEKGVRAEN